MKRLEYTTPAGIVVAREFSRIPFARGLKKLLRDLDTKRGVFLSSGYEYPGRYSRWEVASVAPPIEIIGRGRVIELRGARRLVVWIAQIGRGLLCTLGDATVVRATPEAA